MPTIYRTKSTRQRKNKDGSNAPQPQCEICKSTIEVGMPHKNVSVRQGSSSVIRIRCVNEPDWKPWEISNSLSARLQEVSHNFWEALGSAYESEDDVSSALSDAAEAIREIAEEKRESAQNIEDGFGHTTWQSDELNEQADSLESWADEVENLDIPDPEDADELDDWRSEVQSACSLVDEPPV